MKKETLRGRPPYGSEPKEHVVKFSTSLPPDLYERLEKYCADDERDKAYAIRKALDVWLEGKGY